MARMNTTLARPVLSASFAVTSLIGAGFLLAFWLPTDTAAALVRSTLFAACMAAAHWFGYRLYIKQGTLTMNSRNVDFSLVRPHLSVISLTQLPSLLLGAILLDGGRGLRICVVAIFAHWLAIAFVSTRNRNELTRLDTFVIRWGFFPCIACAVLISNAPIFW